MTKKMLFCVIMCSALSPYAFAEYLIVKFDEKQGTFVPLDQNDAKDFEKIHNILLDYQWPSNLANKQPLPDDHPVFQPKEAAEEKFIRDLIKKDVGKQYDILFIPTTTYELFILKEFLAMIPQLLSTPLLGPLKEMYTFFKDIRFGDEIRSIVQDTAKTTKDIVDLYRKDNQPKDLNGNNILITFHFALNNELLQQLPKEMVDSLNKNRDMNLVPNSIKDQIFNITAAFIIDVIQRYYDAIKSSTSIQYTRSLFLDLASLDSELNKDKSLKLNGIVANSINAEYDAQTTNKALLFRGGREVPAMLDETEYLLDTGLIIPFDLNRVHSSQKKTSSTIFDFVKAYTGNKFEPYSISYGNSLFAGAILDYNACAYNYISQAIISHKKIGYALFIDKKQYVKNQLNNLFFIAPLNTIVAMFARGEFFHSRSKFAIRQTDFPEIMVQGIGNGPFGDSIGFLRITRDPLEHAYYLSNYLADNARIITPKAQDAVATLLKAQKEIGKAYKTIRVKKEVLGELKKTKTAI